LIRIYTSKNPKCIPGLFDILTRDEHYEHLCRTGNIQESSFKSLEETTLTESEIALLSLKIGDIWEDLGIVAGGLSLTDIEKIRNNPNRKMWPHEMLQKWRFNSGNGDACPLTKNQILLALRDISFEDWEYVFS